MSIIDRHFSVTRTLLGIIGLWPYQTSILAKFQFLCSSILVTTPAILQISTILISPITTKLVIHICSFIAFYCMSMIKYYGVYTNGKTIKCLMKELQDICDNLSDKNEIAIIERYGTYTKRFSAVLLMIFIFGTLFIVMTPIVHYLTNATSINKSRQRIMLTMTSLDNRIPYSMWICVSISLCISTYVLLSTGIMFIAYLHFFCGLFKIASYRVDQAMKSHTVQNGLRNDSYSVYKSISYAADLHQKAMMFSKHLITNFNKTFMVIIVSSVVTLSLNMFCNVVLKFGFEEFTKGFIIILSALLYIFCANLMGQAIIDHYGYIFATAYTVKWYIAPINIQKLLLSLLLRGQKAFGLNSMGNFFTASLPCFATLVNASISYFTVMYTMRP